MLGWAHMTYIEMTTGQNRWQKGNRADGQLEWKQAAHVARLVSPFPLQGRAGGMRGRTFTAPKKWLPGKGRVTVQFGCCYNYAKDDQGREAGE